mgnify:CR=1 FL=1
MTTRPKTILLAIGAVAALAVIGWLFATRGPMAPVEVTTAIAHRTDLKPSIFGIGTVEARLSYAIGPTQAGRVLAVHVDHGDTVKAGQLVAEMDPVDLRARVAGAEAALQRAHQGTAIAEAQAQEARSREKVALVNHARYHDLAQRKFVSLELADNRRNEADVATNARIAAEAAVSAAQGDTTRARQELEAVRKQLANTQLLSPVDGIVIARDAEPGSTLVAGQTVVRVIAPRSLWVKTRIDQARANGLHLGQPAEIVLRSGAGTGLPGKVARIDLQSDAVTEERLVAVEFDSPPAVLHLGELAEVTVALPPLAGVLAVPSAAVKRQGEQRGVWQIADGRVRFVAVETGVQTAEGRTQILKGLKEGEQIIAHSSAQLHDGMKVRAAHD